MGYNYKTVYLDSSSRKITVSPEGYRKVLELLQVVKVCETCNAYYSAENPNIAGNVCLSCFSEKHRFLTFMGPLDQESTEPQENPAYLFLSKNDGHTYTTKAGPGVNAEALEDRALTLQYWHFPRPNTGIWNGKTVELSECGWHIYGDVRKSDVIIIEKGKFLFLVMRNGQTIQLSRRKEMHRRLLADALAELEATKQPNHHYFFDGKEHPRILDSHVYEHIVKQINHARQSIQAEQEPEGVTE